MAMRSFSMRDHLVVDAAAGQHVGDAAATVERGVDLRVLGQVAEAALAHHPAGLRLGGAAEHLEQAGLAGAVAADDAHLVAGHHGEAGGVDDESAPHFHRDRLGLEHPSRLRACRKTSTWPCVTRTPALTWSIRCQGRRRSDGAATSPEPSPSGGAAVTGGAVAAWLGAAVVGGGVVAGVTWSARVVAGQPWCRPAATAGVLGAWSLPPPVPSRSRWSSGGDGGGRALDPEPPLRAAAGRTSTPAPFEPPTAGRRIVGETATSDTHPAPRWPGRAPAAIMSTSTWRPSSVGCRRSPLSTPGNCDTCSQSSEGDVVELRGELADASRSPRRSRACTG